MRTAIMPGSFDPFTIGHVDILKRACAIFDFVYVGVLVNCNKKALFSPDERVMQIQKVISAAGIKNAEAQVFQGMLVDFAREKGACACVRGIRSHRDYDIELEMADINRKLYPELEHVYLLANAENACVSSSAVREIGVFGGDISGFLPDAIYEEVRERLEAKV